MPYQALEALLAIIGAVCLIVLMISATWSLSRWLWGKDW